MQKIDRIAYKDVLQRRKLNSLKQFGEIEDQGIPNLLHMQKQTTIQATIEKILKMDSKQIHKCDLNLEEKYSIIQHISEKQKISYNRKTLAQLMFVWKCPGTTYLGGSVERVVNNASKQQFTLISSEFSNFFILYGQVAIFQNQYKNESSVNGQQPSTFQTQSKPESLAQVVEGKKPKFVLQENSGWGPIFKKDTDHFCHQIIRITNAIIVQIKTPEFQSMLINLGGLDQQKKIKAIQYFPTFAKIGKRLLSILPYLQLKKYNKNEYIYKLKQVPQAVYLILRGQIVFQIKLQQSQIKSKYKLNFKNMNQISFQTESLGVGNYFGEEQIILKTYRSLNAICNSANCDLLEIPIDKFQKLCSYDDFHQEIKICSQLRIKKRKQKIDKALQIYLNFNKSPEKHQVNQSPEQTHNQGIESKKAIRKKSMEPAKIMHGNVIKKIPIMRNTEPVNFSMLAANPDMYEATLKKFRKYSIKPTPKYKPQVNWNLKRVWKVLNLQTVLREDSEINCPEGRNFYETHRRFQNHVQQNKSIRPKTSSSSYRTKLQYITYLQQFNG